MQKKLWQRLDWGNTAFLVGTPLVTAILLVVFFQTQTWNPWLLVLFFGFYIATGMAITGGYHRLFSHRAYQAHWIVKLFYLLFGAAAFQNSALKWCADHRVHHQFSDKEKDPYNITKGFFHAHMGWVMLKERKLPPFPKDLVNDPLVMWQHKYYLWIAAIVGLALPTWIGWLMGSALGGLVFGGFARIVFTHHCTFFINSLCHMVGTRPFSEEESARDSFIMAFLTYGEGYHNFHHRFQTDFRNGFRWFHFDPTKWLIRSLSSLGLTWGLKRTSSLDILKARLKIKESKMARKLEEKAAFNVTSFESLKHKVELAQQSFHELRLEYHQVKKEMTQHGHEKIKEIRARLKHSQREFQEAYSLWLQTFISQN